MALPRESALALGRSEEAPVQLGQPHGARLFLDGRAAWAVYEDCHPHVGRSLIFDSDRVFRRVRNYPANWRDLTDEQLAELSLSR